MRYVRALLLLLVFTVTPALALSLADISNQDAASALKSALEQGSAKAVEQLGRPDGFLKNMKVKIPLPPKLKRVESMMRTVGMGRQADELVTAMNRAAEAAVPEAKTLLVDAVKQMSVQDAKQVLTGPPDAATQYFKRTTSSKMTERFLPIVKEATQKVQLAEIYNNYAGKAANFGLLSAEDANLDTYVTQKALDGLFLQIAEEEKAIRRNPASAATSIVQRVFGAIGK
ncbi:MAG TPA: DUF4197 domain-containing protein [Burkholderiales bacterium]|nr:DUF4197 domain-containing protein [Burkholderiales bacterium]